MSVSVSEEQVSRVMASLLEADARHHDEIVAMGGIASAEEMAKALVMRSLGTMRDLGMAECDDAGGVSLTDFGRAVLAHPRAKAISAAMNETNAGRA